MRSVWCETNTTGQVVYMGMETEFPPQQPDILDQYSFQLLSSNVLCFLSPLINRKPTHHDILDFLKLGRS